MYEITPLIFLHFKCLNFLPANVKHRKMVICFQNFQNCSDLLWEKIVLVIEKKLLKFKAEGREFAKILRSHKQLIWTVKGQYNFWNRKFQMLKSENSCDSAYLLEDGTKDVHVRFLQKKRRRRVLFDPSFDAL